MGWWSIHSKECWAGKHACHRGCHDAIQGRVNRPTPVKRHERTRPSGRRADVCSGLSKRKGRCSIRSTNGALRTTGNAEEATAGSVQFNIYIYIRLAFACIRKSKDSQWVRDVCFNCGKFNTDGSFFNCCCIEISIPVVCNIPSPVTPTCVSE
jgi:hypothetical protein